MPAGKPAVPVGDVAQGLTAMVVGLLGRKVGMTQISIRPGK